MRSRWALAALSMLMGCGLPRDPDKTLERVRGGTLRVGIADNPPWTRTEPKPSGREVELIRALASELNAEVQWERGAESELLERLHERTLDLVAAGVRKSTPWAPKLGLSRPHSEDATGEGYVLATPPGENAWLLHVDRFIAERGRAP